MTAKPRFRTSPAFSVSKGSEVVDFARSVGLELDDWQSQFLEDAMGVDGSGKWVSDEAALVVPRQNGKSVVLLARALWGAVLGGEDLILLTAHQFKTARESFLQLKAIVESPVFVDLYGEAQVSVSHGKEGITFANGNRILVIARSRTSGRGFSPDMVVLDEAFELDDLALASLRPALAAKANPALWYASSAPHESSSVLRRVCLRGRSGESDRLAYVEYCADDGVSPDSVAAWRQANPALGSRITLEFVAGEYESFEHAPEHFERERLGVWSEEAFTSIFDLHHWQSLGVHDAPKVTGRRIVAVDVSPDRVSTVAAAGELADGRILVQVLHNAPGTGWVAERVAGLAADGVLVDGAGQSQTVIAPLTASGVEVRRINAGEMVAASGGFLETVLDSRILHMDQGELNAAVEGAKQRQLGDGWAWGRRTSQVDVSPLVAVSLAVFGLAREPEPEWVPIVGSF